MIANTPPSHSPQAVRTPETEEATEEPEILTEKTTPEQRSNRNRKRFQRISQQIETTFDRVSTNWSPDSRKEIRRKLADTWRKASGGNLEIESATKENRKLRSNLMRQLIRIKSLRVTKKKTAADNVKVKAAIQNLLAESSCKEVAAKLGVSSAVVRTVVRQRSCRAAGSSHALTAEEINQIHQVYQDNRISTCVPHKKFAGKRFLTVTIGDAYQRYKTIAEEQGRPVRSFSTFSRNRPKTVKLTKYIPDMGCACRYCTNFGLLQDAVIKSGVAGISSQMSSNICKSLCDNEGSSGNDIMKRRLKCIDRQCPDCGTAKFFEDICIKKDTDHNNAKNQADDVNNWRSESATYHRWQKKKKYVMRKGVKTEKSRFRKLTCNTTIMRLLTRYLQELSSMAIHYFITKWQSDQYERAKENLKTGDILMVCDFGTNLTPQENVEPMGTNWKRKQVAVHNAVCFFKCPECETLCKDEIAIFSKYLVHDWAAVAKFTDVMIKHLQNRGIAVKRVIRFSDNCSGQYRSKNVFYSLSESPIPILANTFSASHGKKEADGVGGRTAQMLERAKKSGAANPRTAEEIADFCNAEVHRVQSGKEALRRNHTSSSTSSLSEETKDGIASFCSRSDVSAMLATGDRYMLMSTAAAHTKFNDERRAASKEGCSLSTFRRHVPPDIVQGMGIGKNVKAATANAEPVQSQSSPRCSIECIHNRSTFFNVDDIDSPAELNTETVDGTLKLHSFRNTGKPNFIEARRFSCLCQFCLDGDTSKCDNEHFVAPFTREDVTVKSAGPVDKYENCLWGGNHAVDLNRRRPWQRTTKSEKEVTFELAKSWDNIKQALSIEGPDPHPESSEELESSTEPPSGNDLQESDGEEQIPRRESDRKKRKLTKSKMKEMAQRHAARRADSDEDDSDFAPRVDTSGGETSEGETSDKDQGTAKHSDSDEHEKDFAPLGEASAGETTGREASDKDQETAKLSDSDEHERDFAPLGEASGGETRHIIQNLMVIDSSDWDTDERQHLENIFCDSSTEHSEFHEELPNTGTCKMTLRQRKRWV